MSSNVETMTDFEIDRRLALAIGYRPKDVQIECGVVYVRLKFEFGDLWKRFDHADWLVASPIAEMYDLFPVRLTDGKWSRVVCGPAPAFLLTDIIESTPQRCIAVAALCALERK